MIPKNGYQIEMVKPGKLYAVKITARGERFNEIKAELKAAGGQFRKHFLYDNSNFWVFEGKETLQNLKAAVERLDAPDETPGEVCGNCHAWRPDTGQCCIRIETILIKQATDVACKDFNHK